MCEGGLGFYPRANHFFKIPPRGACFFIAIGAIANGVFFLLCMILYDSVEPCLKKYCSLTDDLNTKKSLLVTFGVCGLLLTCAGAALLFGSISGGTFLFSMFMVLLMIMIFMMLAETMFGVCICFFMPNDCLYRNMHFTTAVVLSAIQGSFLSVWLMLMTVVQGARLANPDTS